ncbi:MAG TPA: adenylosuccinate synthase [Anaerolineae bacterium]|nr:adenylosuccinate synthase [Anaerolineae bacterium]
MPVTALIGAQWGDEGKGHIADKLAAQSAIVARYNGGDNAGHSITMGETLVRTHLIPAGAFHPHSICVLGAGMVINLRSLAREVDELNRLGANLNPARLKIDQAAHLLLPSHIALDGAGERQRGSDAIGTTQRGIGPAYTDKAARIGLRAGRLAYAGSFAEAVGMHVERTNTLLTRDYHLSPLDPDAIVAEYSALAARFAPHLADTTTLIHAALERGDHVLAEGAQGTLLDLDHGTYPFVTSSSTTSGGVLTALGIGPRHVTRVIGIAKAFCSRVGAGPFPTELNDALGDQLRGTGANPWDEYGSTTGRPRRTGWLDLVALKYAARVNGLTELVLTKLDILTGLDPLRVCTAYSLHGEATTDFPGDAAVLYRCKPVYTELPGWRDNITGARRLADLPSTARAYIEQIQSYTGVPVSHVSVGPDRSQIFEC